MKKLHFYVLSAVSMLTYVISFAQAIENPNPYAIFGGNPYVIGSEKQPNIESVFVIANLDKNTDVALLSHNPQKGTVTLFDKQGNVLNEVRLSDNDKVWTTIDPKASEYYATSPYAYCLNSPVRFIDPNGKEVELFGIDRYLNRDNPLRGGTINNDMVRTVGGFEISPYQNKAGDIIGWSAYRNGMIQYVMDDPDDITAFTENVSTYSLAADLFYMNGTPSEGMLKMLAREIGSGLVTQWAEALKDPAYYMYVANMLGASAMMLPKSVKNVSFSDKAAIRMAEKHRYVPVSLQEATINSSRGIPDPQGTRALMYNSTIYRKGKPYNLEVLYDKKTNSIWHFKYE